MIEVNLLPQELRKKQVSQFTPPFLGEILFQAERAGFTLPKKYLNNALLLLIAAIALLHLLVQALIIAKSLMFTYADKQLISIQPQRQLVDEMKGNVQKYKALDDLFLQSGAQRMNIAPVLNFISDNLPAGVWLSEFSLSKEGWELKGGCVSASGSEMAQIGKLLNALKHEAGISAFFPKLELAQVLRKKYGVVEVVEFAINSPKQAKAVPKKKK